MRVPHRRRLAALFAVLAMAMATAAAPAEAKLIAYGEGLTNVDTSGSAIINSVKPATSGTNVFHWYHKNDTSGGQPTAVCFRYQINNGGFKNPDGTGWTFPPAGFTGNVPGNSAACTGPYAANFTDRLTKSRTGLADGTVVEYCATEYIFYSSTIGWDWSGTYRCNTVVIDSAAPTTGVRITQGGNDVSVTNNPAAATINIDYSDPITRPVFFGGQYGYNLACATTGAACIGSSTFNYNAACSNGNANKTQTFTCPLGSLSDGTHYKCFAVYDGAVIDATPSQAPADPSLGGAPAATYNLVNNVIACDSILVDTVAPDTSITAGPSEGSTITTNSTSFSFTGTGSPSGYECQLDGGGYANCTSPRSLTGLSNGSHNFRVRAKDAAGNIDGSPVVRNFNVNAAPPPDTTPPETTITAGPAEGSSSTATTYNFSFSANETATFACSLDGGPFSSCTSPFTTGTLAVGTHSFRVSATDTAGNIDPSPASRSFTVTAESGGGGGGGSGGGGSGEGDTKKPETTIKGAPKDKTSSTTAKFSFDADEAASFECSLDGKAFSACSSPFSKRVSPGKHEFEVRAVDEAGNVDASPDSHRWTVKRKRKRR